jgi:hypothetical protein
MLSFMQAVMERASTSENLDVDSVQSSSQYTEQSTSLYRPQANSVAMALGMEVDPSSQTSAIREGSSVGLMQAVISSDRESLSDRKP